MEDINGDIIFCSSQWRKLWQFVSGIHYGTPNADVKEKLFQVSKELVDGILHYKKPTKASEEKLQKLIKDRNQLKLQPFANKLHQYLDIDAVQSWQILCYYLVNEYRGAATALAEYISTETSMVKLLHDIWTYHTLERMVQLKVMKNLLEYFHSGTHPYSKEYREVVEKMGLQALRKSYLAQLTHLIADPPSSQKAPLAGDLLHGQTRVACAERRLRETNEILQILLLIVHYSGISPEELDQLFKLFREHSFGKQQEHLDPGSEIHAELVKRITYNELALVFRTLDLSDKFDDAGWIERVVAALDGPMVSLHQFPEHGPLLLVWMLFNFRLQHTVEDEDTTRRYQQLGSRAIKLGVFEYLHAIVSHPMFKDQSLTARIVRKSIFNHLGFLCQLFDADESIAHHSNIYDLLSELLTSPTIATEFCKIEDHPIRALFNICLEHFPVEFTPLSKVAYALASAGSSQNKYIQELVENLPVYTELYTGQNQYEIRKAASSNEDEFILCHDYTPSSKINFTIPRGTKLIVRDLHNQRTYVHFSTGYNYFNALHHEINELLEDAQATSTLNSERVQRIATGLKYLAVAVRRIQQPHDITAEMVHPTEMVFDVLLKFRAVPNPPVDLLVQCLNVCTALVPLFEQEIYTRIINLNILPSVNNANLTYQDYANGVGYDSSLIGYYLMNVERNAGRYPILMAYFNFLKTYTKLGRDNVFGVELPGAIFLLREVLPYANNWRFETSSDRYRVLVFVVQYIYEILQLSEDKLESDYARRVLRDACVYSLLNRDNGMVLLKIVGLGNGYLQAVMERESNWMLVPEQQLNLMIQHSMTILMQILRLKRHIHEYDLSPLESAIYTQPKQRDTLRIIPMVTGYMSNIFNPRLPILSCRLLRRFAIEFRMSLLACLDMEPDQIRHTFLERLHDEIESDDLKLAVLEFVESCVHKQPGLTEAFFKVNYGKPDRRLLLAKDGAAASGSSGKGRPKTMINDGIPTYMEEFLEAISNDPAKLASPLLSRIMSLFHALWKNNMQALVKGLLQKPNFWSSLCNPLFSEQTSSNVRSYSQLFNILGIELFRVSSATGLKMGPELTKVFERFTQTFGIFKRWVDIVLELPHADTHRQTADGSEGNVSVGSGGGGGGRTDNANDPTPDWLGRLQSFKDLIVLIVRKKEPGISLPDRCKTYLAERLLAVLVERVEQLQDLRPLIVLSELYLIVLSDFDHKFTEDATKDDQMLGQIETLLSLLAISYADIHQRAKEALLAIGIKTVELQADCLLQNYTLAAEITRAAVDIAGEEIHALELAIQAHGLKAKTVSDAIEGKQYNSLLLAINLLKQLTISFDQPEAGSATAQASARWVSWLVKGKLFQRLLSITGTVLPEYGRRKLVTELLNLLILLAESRCSEELLYSDVGDYLWLKLLPPKELLQRPYVMANETQQQWQTQDWWPIYSKGIHLVRALLSKHGYRFLRDAIFFVGIHEEYLMDSLMLAKQSLEPSAFVLILETLQLLCTMVPFEKEWRLEHSQSLLNLMRCTQFLMDHSISLLYRPKILKRLTTGTADAVGFIVSELEMDPSTIDTSDELVGAMNNLIEIITLCAKCLLCFSPPLLSLLCDVEFIPSQWCPLIEIQFGAPKLSNDNYSQLSFGSLLQAVCIFTKVLNLQHYSFHETPLNELPAQEGTEQDDTSDGSLTMGLLSRGNRSALGESPSPAGSPSDGSRLGKRVQFAKTLSMTSVSSYTSTNAITLSNELLTHLDTKRCVCGLEYVLTLLTSQSLFALKDTNLSQREKQLIKRELSTELLIFHDFVKKRILKDAKCILSRKKHGVVPIINDPYAAAPDHDTDNDDEAGRTTSGGKSTSDRSKSSTAQQSKKQSSASAQHSMRINVVRKMHLQHQQHQGTEQQSVSSSSAGNVLSPIAGTSGSQDVVGRSSSTPVLRGILKPSPSASIKRVMFDDGLNESAKSMAYVEPEDEPIFYEPQEPRFTGLSHVQMVEEDYIHLLSNVLLMIGQSEN
ncbi:nucleoporin Nup188-like isoform X1 [Anopheles merus]|uniref:nucleoporin Nup188-like isoform X1 n=1 Tax=Anopheles merus TaxID=30066 RepID=UPI001BE47F4C|nr:nucleoporin Nup188-like isoform X1 [Anopheles merus]XP_041771505.1 nucleoporin Nup188-like isoform X1 [Anopheles merus]